MQQHQHTSHNTQKPAPPQQVAPVVADDVFSDAAPKVGSTVHYFSKPDQPWAGIVIRVHSDDVVDLIAFRPDALTSHFFKCPKKGAKFVAGCWDSIA